jgi:DNA (cytosine-5)-methyltransferase 1
LRYGSACSGIEAASAAWHHLGWRPAFFSEIEPFPRAVLAERWPGVPIHGDFTTIEKDTYEPIDLLVCGTPCQDFSVAGLRAGLAGERGFLTIEFVRLAERLRPRWLVWENVPGVLSSDDGRAFGLFLGALGECGYGTAWRVLDAQHFGVPQRRRRVFVVGYLGDWRPPAAVLFERESLRGDLAPRRAAGERVAPCLEACANRTGGDRPPRTCVDTADSLIAYDITGTGPRMQNAANPTDVHTVLRSRTPGHSEGSTTTVVIANPLGAKADGGWRGDLDYVAGARPIAFDARQSDTLVYGDKTGPLDTDAFSIGVVTHSLRAEGFDASEGVGAVAVPIQCNGTNVGTGLPSLRAGNGHITGGGPAIAFDTYNQTTSETVQTLRDPNGTFGDALPAVAVAFHQNVRSEVRITEVMGALNTGGGKPGQGYPAVLDLGGNKGMNGGGWSEGVTPPLGTNEAHGIQHDMSVRRLTPVECERLQGFPDDYTLITYRKKPAADGPRYRALGNSMAVPCMRWIGERIALVEEQP